jgi:ABC-type Fe3+-hydroxamate transport system substrate-binding protein
MRKIILLLLGGLLLLTFAACSKTEQANSNQPTATPSGSPATEAKNPPENIVTTSAAEVQLAAGGEAVASVQLNIASGYHVNANPASGKYLIATKLDVESTDGITAGQPQYPPSLTKKFTFSPEAIAVYEGQTTIKVPLKAGGNTTKGAHKLSAKLLVQPCDEQACYKPRTIETSLPVVVQ